MENLKRLTRPKILKMDDHDLSFKVAQLMDWELKKEGEKYVAPDYLNNLNDTFDVVNYMIKKGHIILLEFPTTEDDLYTMKRFLLYEGTLIADSVKGKTPQEVILKTALLANIPEKRQKLSVRRAKE